MKGLEPLVSEFAIRRFIQIKLQARIKGRLMGLEPTTYAVTKHRSTIELQTPKGERRVELRTSSLQNYCSTIELFTQSINHIKRPELDSNQQPRD